MSANPGVLHHRAKLSEAEVLYIREAYGSGTVTQKALATKFDINQKTVHEIVRRKIWRHL